MKVELKPLYEEDVNQIYEWRNELFINFRQFRMLTWEEHVKWFENLNPNKELMYGIYYRDCSGLSGVCGLCNLNWVNRSSEISLYIVDKLYSINFDKVIDLRKLTLIELLNINFNQLNFHKAWAEVFDFNETNIKLFNRMGFEMTGTIKDTAFKNGKYVNGYIYSLLEDSYRKLVKNNFGVSQTSGENR